jgi:hypothetical protein
VHLAERCVRFSLVEGRQKLRNLELRGRAELQPDLDQLSSWQPRRSAEV